MGGHRCAALARMRCMRVAAPYRRGASPPGIVSSVEVDGHGLPEQSGLRLEAAVGAPPPPVVLDVVICARLESQYFLVD